MADPRIERKVQELIAFAEEQERLSQRAMLQQLVVVSLSIVLVIAIVLIMIKFREHLVRNLRKRLLFALGILFILSAMFPPWVWISSERPNLRVHTPAGYSFLADPPLAGSSSTYIDFQRLFLQWCCLAAATGLVLATKPAHNRPLEDRTAVST